MTATEASLKALAAHTQKRRESVDTRARKALQSLRREKVDITISSVARRAGVTRKSIHSRPELLAQIDAHKTLSAVPTELSPPPDGAESSIVAALRNRLTAKDIQLAQLRAELRDRDNIIAVLQGELERLSR